MKVTTTITTLFLTIVMAVPTSYTEVKAHASDVANIRMYYDLHPTQASRGLARVKTERMAGRQQIKGVPKTAC